MRAEGERLLLVTVLVAALAPAPWARGAGGSRSSTGESIEVVSGEIGAAIDRQLQGIADWNGSVLVASGGAILLAKGYGVADPSTRAPATAQTIYDLGHLSKWMTATMVLRLADLGLLSIDEEVVTHFPQALDGLPGTTIRLLLAETAGIQSKFPADAFPQAKMNDRAWAVEAASQIEPRIDAGKIRLHSTPCWLLAALCAENASGAQFQELMSQQVFVPMGMHESGVCGDDRLDAARAAQREHDATGRNETLSCAANDSGWATRGSNGMAGSVFDLFRFRTVLASGELLSGASHDAMWLVNGQQRGLGIDVAPGPRYTALNAVTSGCCQYCCYVPEGDFFVAMLGRGRLDLAKFGTQLIERAREEASAEAGKELIQSVAGLAGEYRHPELGRFGIVVEGGVPAICAWDQAVADRLFGTGKQSSRLTKQHASQAETAGELVEALTAGDDSRIAKLLGEKVDGPTVRRTRAAWGRAASEIGDSPTVDSIVSVERGARTLTALRVKGEDGQVNLVVTWAKKRPASLTSSRSLPICTVPIVRADGGWWRAATARGDVHLLAGQEEREPAHLWWHDAGEKKSSPCPRAGQEPDPGLVAPEPPKRAGSRR